MALFTVVSLWRGADARRQGDPFAAVELVDWRAPDSWPFARRADAE